LGVSRAVSVRRRSVCAALLKQLDLPRAGSVTACGGQILSGRHPIVDDETRELVRRLFVSCGELAELALHCAVQSQDPFLAKKRALIYAGRLREFARNMDVVAHSVHAVLQAQPDRGVEGK